MWCKTAAWEFNIQPCREGVHLVEQRQERQPMAAHCWRHVNAGCGVGGTFKANDD